MHPERPDARGWLVLARSGNSPATRQFLRFSISPHSCTHISVLCELLNAQQTRLPTPKPQVGTRGFAQGEAPTPQREGRQIVVAARRGNGDLVLRKTVHQRKTQAIFSRCTSSRQVGTAADLCGDCILWLNLSTGSRVRQGGGQPPNARFVTEEKIGFVGVFPYLTMASVASVKRGGKRQA